MSGDVRDAARQALCPVSFAEACAFVRENHRHHKPPHGHKFSIGVNHNGELIGVIMVGRPVARMFDDGLTLEVTRSCTIGEANTNSMLYGAAWRATKALGYRRLITYTLASESGASLRASGYRIVAERKPRAGWSCVSRPRLDTTTEHNVERTLWEAS